MEKFPKVIFRGESVDFQYTSEDGVNSLTFYATNIDTNPETGDGVIYKFSKAFRRENDGNIFNLKLSDSDDFWTNLSTGKYQYQIWSNLGRNKKSCCFTGDFTIVPSIKNRLDNPEIPDAGYTSENERKLRRLQQTYDEYMASGTVAYTLSGNSTTRLSQTQLMREIKRLKRIVNRERKAKGLPYLPGTLPTHIIETYLG